MEVHGQLFAHLDHEVDRSRRHAKREVLGGAHALSDLRPFTAHATRSSLRDRIPPYLRSTVVIYFNEFLHFENDGCAPRWANLTFHARVFCAKGCT